MSDYLFVYLALTDDITSLSLRAYLVLGFLVLLFGVAGFVLFIGNKRVAARSNRALTDLTGSDKFTASADDRPDTSVEWWNETLAGDSSDEESKQSWQQAVMGPEIDELGNRLTGAPAVAPVAVADVPAYARSRPVEAPAPVVVEAPAPVVVEAPAVEVQPIAYVPPVPPIPVVEVQPLAYVPAVPSTPAVAPIRPVSSAPSAPVTPISVAQAAVYNATPVTAALVAPVVTAVAPVAASIESDSTSTEGWDALGAEDGSVSDTWWQDVVNGDDD